MIAVAQQKWFTLYKYWLLLGSEGTESYNADGLFVCLFVCLFVFVVVVVVVVELSRLCSTVLMLIGSRP